MVSYKALNTALKCQIIYACHTIRNDYVRQGTTTGKCTITYASQTIRDDNVE